jgi:hypothetical protein
MAESISLFLVMLTLLELFELSWQKGTNFQEYLKNLFHFYKKGVLYFLILHPTFYFSLFSQIFFDNYTFFASLLSLIKFFDITFKLSIMDKLYNGRDLGILKEAIKENAPLPKFLKFSGIVLYPILFFFAYTQMLS